MSLFTGKALVVPWDFSEMSQASLQKAIDCVDDPSLIRVVHVATLPPAGEPGVLWGTVTEDSIAEHCQESFAKYCQGKPGYDRVTFTTLFGDPGSQITEYAENENAELIIISSHGHTGLAHLFIGSVAERVVRLAHCPVLVLRS
ncbi:universal stress protein [Allorhodopirellula solitaria]|uniref:Universal stress protein n=1 Tax=Allorhodopirellula solitaria TaxID=2527987 RepID=A0A5C5XPT9_9BACT|nr:universal stress protein [Allorhodopirellula solitaria]TWT64970.1 Universal stress protein [Allorhodopirellula solitaria]